MSSQSAYVENFSIDFRKIYTENGDSSMDGPVLVLKQMHMILFYDTHHSNFIRLEFLKIFWSMVNILVHDGYT